MFLLDWTPLNAVVSRHKFASNVCEKALIHCRPEDRRELVDELIDVKPDGTTNVPMLLRDAFGNFPLQVGVLQNTCYELIVDRSDVYRG